MTSPSQHISLVRGVLTRELERRERENANRVGAYPTVEEVRAALDSLDALAVAVHVTPPAITHITHAQELTS